MASEEPLPELPAVVLEEIFARAPAAFQCLTAAQLDKAWYVWSKGRPEDVRRQCQRSNKPLWFLSVSYYQLIYIRRLKAACCAAEAGDLEALEVVHAAGGYRPTGVCTAAARGGHLEALRFLRGRPPLGRVDVPRRSQGRPPGGAAPRARGWMPLG